MDSVIPAGPVRRCARPAEPGRFRLRAARPPSCPKRPNVALGALTATNVALGASDAPNATLGFLGTRKVLASAAPGWAGPSAKLSGPVKPSVLCSPWRGPPRTARRGGRWAGAATRLP
ncbi:hypothetical protein CU254_19545 [Amycolatopsis sp. AA4]|nr:hypothetical protein CU254_19545 [Amycolatopsis sp. AA4]